MFAVPMGESEAFLDALKQAGVQTAAIIGQVVEKGEYPIYVK